MTLTNQNATQSEVKGRDILLIIQDSDKTLYLHIEPHV